MSRLDYYQNIIQEKRKKTPFRDFVKELGSWEALNLYKRNGKICRYPESDRIKKLGDDFWTEAPGIFLEYDNSKNFFANLKNLIDICPYAYIFQFENNENSEFADGIFEAKNTYLSFIIGFRSENVAYSGYCYTNVENIFNSFLACINCSNVYMSGGVNESHNIFYSRYITNSSDIWFSTNLIGCHDCIGCDDLENQKFMIGNIQHTEAEFRKKKAEILKDKKSFEKNYRYISSRKGKNLASTEVDGDYIVKSSNIENGAWVVNIHDSRNVVIANGDTGSKNFYDGLDVGMNSEHFYGVVGAGGTPVGAAHIYSSTQITSSMQIYYCQYLADCHHCLGCIGLKNKSYCILNKQYTKEEWEEKACEIFASMESDGTLGDFFPASLCPFYFNDTLAYLVDDSFTKEEVEGDGYLWRDEPIRADIPEGMKVVKNTELDQYQGWTSPQPSPKGEGAYDVYSPSLKEKGLGDEVWYIDPEILNVVISDEKGNHYRIVKMEYDFLMKHGLPLPTMHWLDRMKMGFR